MAKKKRRLRGSSDEVDRPLRSYIDKSQYELAPQQDEIDQPMEIAPPASEDSGISNRTKTLLAAGATPMLVGLLTGNAGDAAGIAAKNVKSTMDRFNKEDDDLMSYLRKKNAKTDKPTRRYKPARLDNRSYATFDEVTGRYFDPNTRIPIDDPKFYVETPEIAKKKALAREEGKYGGGVYGRKTVKDQEGRQQILDVKTKGSKQAFKDIEEGISPEFKKTLDKRYTALQSRNRDDIKALKLADKAMTLLDTKGIMPNRVALNMAVKITEDRATEEDKRFVLGHVSTIKNLKERLKEEKSGEVRKRLIDEARRLFGEIRNRSKEIIKKDVESAADAISRSPVEKQKAVKYFSDLYPSIKFGSVSLGKTSAKQLDPSKLSDEELDARIKELKGGQ